MLNSTQQSVQMVSSISNVHISNIRITPKCVQSRYNNPDYVANLLSNIMTQNNSQCITDDDAI